MHFGDGGRRGLVGAQAAMCVATHGAGFARVSQNGRLERRHQVLTACVRTREVKAAAGARPTVHITAIRHMQEGRSAAAARPTVL